MLCSVVVPNSPVFSPSSSLFCNKASIISPFHEALTLNPSHFKPSDFSSPLCSSPSSPSSPFSLRVSKRSSGLSAPAVVSTSSSPNTTLKRKRPMKLNIPVASLSIGDPLVTPSPVMRNDILEVERDGYSVYCKRGRREALEDRYSATLNLQGDSKQVSYIFCSFFFEFYLHFSII